MSSESLGFRPTPTSTANVARRDVAASHPVLWPLLVAEGLFALVGGFMDAYAFVGHGGVFANAQTGNIVMLAAYATIGNWNRAMRHFPPIVTFIVSVAFAKSCHLP